MEILDASGQVVRTQMVAAKAGLNGFNWDLLLDPPELVELRTTPPDNPHIWEEARFKGTDVRRITHWGITGSTGIPMAAPGKYQVRFTVDGTALTQPFEVIKDPAVETSVEDLDALDAGRRCESATTSARRRAWSTRWRSGARRSRIS